MNATPRRAARSYHTRLGWWVMSHERGGSLVIGGVALAVLGVDLSYAASRWGGSFGRWFLIGVGFVALCAVVATLVRFLPFGGESRVAARRSQRAINGVGFVLIVAFVRLGFDGDWRGTLLGLLAALAAFFALFSAIWLVRRPSRS